LVLPDRLLDRFLHPGVQSHLGHLHLAGPLLELAGPLLELGLPPLRPLLQLLERVSLVPKFLLYAGGVGLPLIEGLPGLLQLRLGISQLAWSLLQLLTQSL